MTCVQTFSSLLVQLKSALAAVAPQYDTVIGVLILCYVYAMLSI